MDSAKHTRVRRGRGTISQITTPLDVMTTLRQAVYLVTTPSKEAIPMIQPTVVPSDPIQALLLKLSALVCGLSSGQGCFTIQ
ncbi:hypothetical protein [Nocardia callitridis]|uniref:Uncharacterized protein n=1 Tax=Nocardia callitridis TaxID=648753 RepID=A0ABP9JUD6_9NOCA